MQLDVINEADAKVDMLQVKLIDHCMYIDRLYKQYVVRGTREREASGGWNCGGRAKSRGVAAVLGAPGVLHQEEEVTVW